MTRVDPGNHGRSHARPPRVSAIRDPARHGNTKGRTPRRYGNAHYEPCRPERRSPPAPSIATKPWTRCSERVRRVEASARTPAPSSQRPGSGRAPVAVWASAVVSSPFLDNVPDPGAYLLRALGICTGLVCLVIPWERISPVGLQVAIVAATAEVAAWVALAGPSYGVYYVVRGRLCRLRVAPARRGRRAGGVDRGGAARAARLRVRSRRRRRQCPADHARGRDLSVMAAWVRGHVTSRQRLYRQFAVEALRLAVQIRGDALAPQPLSPLPGMARRKRLAPRQRSVSGREPFEQLATELETLSGQDSRPGSGRVAASADAAGVDAGAETVRRATGRLLPRRSPPSDYPRAACASASSTSTSFPAPPASATRAGCWPTPSTRWSWPTGSASTTCGRSSTTSSRSTRTRAPRRSSSPPPASARAASAWATGSSRPPRRSTTRRGWPSGSRRST